MFAKTKVEVTSAVTDEFPGRTSHELLLNGQVLPTNIEGSPLQFEEMGIRFGNLVVGREHLTHCTLPVAWRIEKPPALAQADQFYQFYKLLDSKSRYRAAISLNESNSPRSALLIPRTFFTIGANYDQEDYTYGIVRAGGVEVHRTDNFSYEDVSPSRTRNRARAAARCWADQNYPDWRNPGAYWDNQQLSQAGKK